MSYLMWGVMGVGGGRMLVAVFGSCFKNQLEWQSEWNSGHRGGQEQIRTMKINRNP